ncbi:Uncharacterised protein (plasmid) [Legionella adelaidensis]|uniref:Uncharacterized protein n=1 Tax=Legionella adelaidensis TaxID=45056 RepID=A0A0W0R4Z6_9GAMM|nr:hypothetical protein [Legionella adelaidensis]KTC66144.1 hypothetical protein Lade_0802 [Legionella adelaidensis]VEH85656.1 Uncharacterised protein [Legionella adelaidensis]
MNEINLLEIFYASMLALGEKRENVFLSIDEDFLTRAKNLYGSNVTFEHLEKLADICIANEWLERTTADPYYNYLSLTEAGLQVVLMYEYKK